MKKLYLALALLSVGCASYTTPGAGVSLAGINEVDIAEAFSREPAAQFPANVAVARVQASGYSSRSNSSYGRGGYSVVTTRDIETDEDFATIGSIQGISAVAPLTRILVPAQLSSTRDLRVAAAQLKADLLVLYTIDTSFRTDIGKVGPLQTIALGFLPNRKSHVDATTSAMVVDVRSGFVFGTVESTKTESQRSDLWGTEAAIESARHTAERESFESVIVQLRELLLEISTTINKVPSVAT